jgi:hypothetical protein
VARMDDGGQFPRLGSLGGRRPRRNARHQHLAGRRGQGRLEEPGARQRVGPRARHLRRLSAKASGVKVYYNGEEQPTNVEADTLNRDDADRVPFKLGQRHATSPITGAAIRDLRLYKRALPPAKSKHSRAHPHAAAILAAKPADERTEAEKRELYNWWLHARRPLTRRTVGRRTRLEKEREADINARGTIAHVMQEQNRTRPRRSFCSAASTTSGATKSSRPRPRPSPRCREDLPRNRLGSPSGCLRPNTRSPRG